jgi:hypothetical protein
MKTPILIAVAFITLLFSCENIKNKSQEVVNTVSKTDTLQLDTSKSKIHVGDSLWDIPKNIKPVFGYRFIISGDFDGDGKKEKLIEHYFSSLDNKETNKFYDSLTQYGQLVDLTISKKPYSFAVSDNKLIDTLHISSSIRQLGLAYLKNEGDLNGDGTDEISYVVNNADWSNLNTWHLMTFKNNRWQELYSFSIWDWQLPDLPETFNQYGLFGLEDKVINTSNDTVNLQLEKELNSFKGLVKKIKINKIRIDYRNDEGEESSKVVNLKRLK